MNPIHLTEAWRVTIFLALVSILIFGLGLPVLIVQLIARDAVKRVVERNHFQGRAFPIALTFLAGLSAASYLWEAEFISVRSVEWLTSLLITCLLITTAFYWFFELHRYEFSRVLAKLANRLDRSAGSDVFGEQLEDLVALSQSSQNDAELRASFQVLYKVAGRIVDDPNYRGDGLDKIIESIPRMCSSAAASLHSANDYIVDLLTFLNSRIAVRQMTTSIDALRLTEKWYALGTAALTSAESARALRYSQGFTSDLSKQFHFGVLAVTKEIDLIALSTLDTLLEIGADRNEEAQVYAIGVASHLALRSSSHRDFVVGLLSKQFPVKTLTRLLAHSTEFFAVRAHFLSTAGAVSALFRELRVSEVVARI